jgi:hypothetical protein
MREAKRVGSDEITLYQEGQCSKPRSNDQVIEQSERSISHA